VTTMVRVISARGSPALQPLEQGDLSERGARSHATATMSCLWHRRPKASRSTRRKSPFAASPAVSHSRLHSQLLARSAASTAEKRTPH
jgi:hypothetical protein